VGLEEATALRERNRMTRRSGQSLERRTFRSEQTMAHQNEGLSNRSHLGIGGEGVPPRVDSPDYGVLDGDYAGVGVALLNGAHRASECRNGDLLHRMSPYLGDRAFSVRAAISLECDAHRQISRRRLTRDMRSRTISV